MRIIVILLILCSTALAATSPGVFCPASTINVAAENLDFFYQSPELATSGFEWRFGPDVSGTGTVRCFQRIRKGTMRPAYYPPFAYDSTDAAPTAGTTGNYNTYTITQAGGENAIWNIPALSFSANKINIRFYRQVGGGTIRVMVNNGAGWVAGTTHDTAGTAGVTTSGFLTLTNPVDSDGTGQIRLDVSDAGESAIFCDVVLAHSTQTPAVGDQLTLYSSVAQITPSGSNVEMMFQCSPTEGSYKYIGGSAHQAGDGTNGKQVSVTETWTKDGGAWSPVVGYTVGTTNFVMNRTSTLWYSAGSPDVASANETYTFTASNVNYTNTITTTADLYLQNDMACAAVATNTPALMLLSDGTIKATFLTNDSVNNVGAGIPNSGLFFGGTLANCYMKTVVNSCSPTSTGTSLLEGSTYKKIYFKRPTGFYASGAVKTVDCTYTMGTSLDLGVKSYTLTGTTAFVSGDTIDLGSSYIGNGGVIDGTNLTVTCDAGKSHIVGGTVQDMGDPGAAVYVHNSTNGGGNHASYGFNTHSPVGSMSLMGVGN